MFKASDSPSVKRNWKRKLLAQIALLSQGRFQCSKLKKRDLKISKLLFLCGIIVLVSRICIEKYSSFYRTLNELVYSNIQNHGVNGYLKKMAANFGFQTGSQKRKLFAYRRNLFPSYSQICYHVMLCYNMFTLIFNLPKGLSQNNKIQSVRL